MDVESLERCPWSEGENVRVSEAGAMGLLFSLEILRMCVTRKFMAASTEMFSAAEVANQPMKPWSWQYASSLSRSILLSGRSH